MCDKKKPGPRSKMPDPRVLSELYVDHTAAEIASQYGVSVSTVKAWLRKVRAAVAEGRLP